MIKGSTIIKRRGERGSTMLEALFSFLLLMIIFLGFMQIFKMSAVRMLCDYSSYCAARGRALGYRDYIIERAARVPLMPVSGEVITDQGSNAYANSPYQRSNLGRFGSSNYDAIYLQARHYMMYGAEVVDYAYWDDENDKNSTGTRQSVSPRNPKSNLAQSSGSDDGYAQNLIEITSGFINYPSGFEFLDPQRGKRMTLSTTHDNKYTTNSDDFTYDINVVNGSAVTEKEKENNTIVTMQNYSRYIITEDYWSDM